MHRHLTYANVVATLALIFAMTGVGMAASHYVITSTSQIKPSVRRALHGAQGPAGPAGPQGKEGAAGKAANETELRGKLIGIEGKVSVLCFDLDILTTPFASTKPLEELVKQLNELVACH